MKRVSVIGAGAAGIFAALAAAEQGADVLLFEKNDIVGKKMGITGKGRCNLTNTCPMADFIARTPGHGKFLFSAYQAYTNEDLLNQVVYLTHQTCSLWRVSAAHDPKLQKPVRYWPKLKRGISL